MSMGVNYCGGGGGGDTLLAALNQELHIEVEH